MNGLFLNIFRHVPISIRHGISTAISTLLLSVVIVAFQPPVSGYAKANDGNDKPKNEQTEADEPYLSKSFTMQGAGVLKVVSPNGDIHVEGVKDTNVVTVQLFVKRGYALWSSNKSLENFRITLMKRGNEVVAAVEQKSKNAGLWGASDMSFNFVIRVPVNISASMKTLGGNIKVRNVNGHQLMKTSGGNLELSNLKGEIKGFTQGGHINIESTEGILMAKTYGGNINIKNARGEIRVQSSGGSIRAEGISGSMYGETSGGNIDAVFYSINEGIRLESAAGNIDVVVPRYNGYDLLLEGSSTHMVGDQNFKGEKKTRSIMGQTNEGGIPINLKTNAGRVRLKFEKNSSDSNLDSDVEFDFDFDW